MLQEAGMLNLLECTEQRMANMWSVGGVGPGARICHHFETLWIRSAKCARRQAIEGVGGPVVVSAPLQELTAPELKHTNIDE